MSLQLTFRRLDVTDREALLGDLSRGIYAGHDYLPIVFEEWLHDGRHIIVGAFETTASGQEGRLLAIDTVSLFDEGRTVVFQAMRTLEEMRGKGVAKALSAYMKDFVKRELPQVQRLRISAQSHNISSIGIHVKQGFKPIYTEAVAFGVIDRSKTAGRKAERNTSIRHVTAAELYTGLVALDASARDRLIPCNQLLVDWNPYEVTERQLVWLETQQSMVFHAQYHADGSLKSFAAIQRCGRVSGLHVNITVRAAGDHDAFVAHVLEALRTHSTGCGHVCLGYDQSLRDTLPALDVSKQDGRQPAAVLEIQQRSIPHADFTVDFIQGSQIILEMPVSE